ncbi:MAG TPA: SAV_6107 family HEPN domain-containing protein [Actinophytocola sp.]|nr:SAV_6107 family HEPN domain-containing protein [Actinophytocola sp.]
MTTTLDYRDNQPVSVPEPALTLLSQAERGLTDAGLDPEPAQRFAHAYLAALRAAAALLAVRGRPHRARSRPTSVWTLLASVAPELHEWATFFAAWSSTRESVQAGITRVVNPRSADDLVRQTGQFVDLVTRAIHGTS